MAMPFSPCGDSGECTDKSVEMLQYVFGDAVAKLATGNSVESVTASGNIIATMFSYFNSGVLVVGSIIVSYIAIVGAINTANDGEALGTKWSSLWTPMRIVFGAGMLLPTSSGYSFIQLFVLMISLWAAGFANSIYTAAVNLGVYSPNALIADANKSGEFYGLRDFSIAYTQSKYCSRLVNTTYNSLASSDSTPNVGIVLSQPDEINVSPDGRRSNIYHFKDRNKETNVGGGTPICGTVVLTSYTAKPSNDDTTRKLNEIDQVITSIKYNQIPTLIGKLDSWVDSWPTSVLNSSWDQVNATQFNSILKESEDSIANALTTQATSSQSQVSQVLNDFSETLTDQGWAMAGGWFQRVGAARSGLSSIFAKPVSETQKPNLSSIAGSPEGSQVSMTLSAVMYAVKGKISAEDAKQGSVNRPRFEDMESYFPDTSADNIDGNFFTNITKVVDKVVSDSMETITSIFIGYDSNGKSSICGSSGEMGGSMNRIKCAGDYMVVLSVSAERASLALQALASTFAVAAGAVDAIPIVSAFTDPGSLGSIVLSIVTDIITPFLAKIIFWLSALGFYFSILLPSMPYVIFIMVVVGWLLAVIQSMLVSPIWALMHIKPDQTFVGSEKQGYLLLMSLFVRPALAIIGLFLAVVLSDPIIDYVALAFFEMRSAIQKSTGTIGAVASFNSFTWWMTAFGVTLLPILYMIYSLPQVLADEILRWVGGGLSALGESNAVGNVREGFGRLASSPQARDPMSALPSGPRGRIGQGGGAGNGRSSSGGGSPSAGQNFPPSISNPQGVTPSSTSFNNTRG